MDIQFVSDLMTQFNNNSNTVQTQTSNIQNNIGADLVAPETNIVTNKVPFKLDNAAQMSDVSNKPQMSDLPKRMQSTIPMQSVMRPMIQNQVPNQVPNHGPPRQMVRAEQVRLPTNQIPRNLSNAPPKVLDSDQKIVKSGSNIQGNVDTKDLKVPDTQSSDFYNIFGFQLSKTTVYIILAFIAIIALYYIYKYFTSSSENKDKKKRKPEVSYEQQMKANEDQQQEVSDQDEE